MAIEIKMPALSPTMEEGTLAKWLVKEGDHIGPGDIMAEIETDKATMEFEAVEEGTLAKIAIPEGTENVKVGTIIAMLAEEGEEAGDIAVPDESAAPAPTPQPAPSPAPAPKPPESSTPSPSPAPAAKDGPAASPTARKLAEANGIDLSQIEGTGPKGKITKGDVEAAMGGGGAASVTGANTPDPEASASPAPAVSSDRIIASPLARRMAEQQGIDLAHVKGTGPNGRIVKADIESFDGSAAPAPAPAETADAPAAPAPKDVPDHGAPFEEEKLSNVRKVIARRLTESKQTVPHYYLTIDIRLDPLLDLRKQLNASLEPDGIKLSVNDLLIKALARALMRVPQCNVSYHGDTMRRYSRADISVAVAAPSGLITPVITHADTKGLAQISSEMKELAGKAREGKLMPHEYQGGTASLSNLGMHGIKQFDAVINPPQGMILAVGSGQQQPYVIDGEIKPATVLHASGSFDHRAIDGADGAQLMEAIKSLVENPMGLLV
ncbi:pyruvate dehydrogenase E2 component (dihydrolipoamide acetyltransferase) [Erythrobacter litoralis]|uniref:Dihydrolipoamide acetyltransferase component of pyruvate dehydrogenase complex n=1 Tax=Erythrobacter litoralis TaxID=39960 RepID=A0A074N461_9SPHN|nr:2-oxo acid dehydrogenase subunit E2 [Erythrobacter litoralis]AOL23528.1 pyruvate dehydrogenase E2 component (dihydrolipoamide acetyltransferase) [Erythrobacter litoralis]KEO98988.1 branched-chain alpha-keto acid dehydrogenase subunit E2 [Erythrobacter litoralis]